ncbi:pheromone-processing carboxypeptidase KEX1-like isoform X2 [Orbicella faveolata]|uniref:pheromone-processing carboxypeptidase KEX1-like isoform X2 n=1 Tax=Orbicella faveolata TaxID=48498 RepID=UPI0009E1C999|nr:pheromone-processing carboxypeptidase KEX1-like isoform X2 [Orbicella faveolata]XP_020616204.1 pheromone-processing carboxypeptidase KEX1-like isoform X2 [Orbicella faveolata]
MGSNTPLIPAESPSGSMAKMQVNIEMDHVTKEEDHPKLRFVQPNRKGNDNGDGVSDSDDDSVGDDKGNDDNNGKGDVDGDGDDDGNRNGHANAHGNAKESLIKIIERGNVDEIKQELTPKAMAKCGRNALLVAMEVCRGNLSQCMDMNSKLTFSFTYSDLCVE